MTFYEFKYRLSVMTYRFELPPAPMARPAISSDHQQTKHF